MKILHYSLGFPPYRTGGLTKYCTDLMLGQKEQGYEVGLLWPGQICLLAHTTKIKSRKPVNGISNYELVNPLPVPLDEGIKDIEAFIEKRDKKAFENFLQEIRPDAVHIHTLMGLPKEFLEAANKLSIKTVFTTHDYFGICPKATLFINGAACHSDKTCNRCVECNSNSLSIMKIIIMQSPVYRIFKDYKVVKCLRRRHRNNFFNNRMNLQNTSLKTVTQYDDRYLELRKYYTGMLGMMDAIHFNSSVARDIYTKYVNVKSALLLNITHMDIKDRRKKKEFTGILKLTYLSPTKVHKGFHLLKNVLDELYCEGHDGFHLNIFSETENPSEYMNICKDYKYTDLEVIFDRSDILIAPSIWYETFGFTVLEALCHGVPVIVSENVGAKDLLIDDKYGIIVENGAAELKSCIKELITDRKKLEIINQNILNFFVIKSFEEHVDSLSKIYT